MKKRFSDEQIISILREAEAGVSARELCRKHAISDAIFYTWRKKYDDMEVLRFWRRQCTRKIRNWIDLRPARVDGIGKHLLTGLPNFTQFIQYSAIF